jgi:hypothetical protein
VIRDHVIWILGLSFFQKLQLEIKDTKFYFERKAKGYGPWEASLP